MLFCAPLQPDRGASIPPQKGISDGSRAPPLFPFPAAPFAGPVGHHPFRQGRLRAAQAPRSSPGAKGLVRARARLAGSGGGALQDGWLEGQSSSSWAPPPCPPSFSPLIVLLPLSCSSHPRLAKPYTLPVFVGFPPGCDSFACGKRFEGDPSVAALEAFVLKASGCRRALYFFSFFFFFFFECPIPTFAKFVRFRI